MEIKQTETYKNWEKKLRDSKAKAIIAARLFRLANGLRGDTKHIENGINELRIHYGPGYRVYFVHRNNEFILLLCGGNKTTQAKDIATAKKLVKTLEDIL